MKVLVEIDEIDFENLKRKDKIDRKFLTYYEKLIAYGTPLPEGAEILTKDAYSDLCLRASKSDGGDAE